MSLDIVCMYCKLAFRRKSLHAAFVLQNFKLDLLFIAPGCALTYVQEPKATVFVIVVTPLEGPRVEIDVGDKIRVSRVFVP